jgi:hypothetical protein
MTPICSRSRRNEIYIVWLEYHISVRIIPTQFSTDNEHERAVTPLIYADLIIFQLFARVGMQILLVGNLSVHVPLFNLFYSYFCFMVSNLLQKFADFCHESSSQNLDWQVQMKY